MEQIGISINPKYTIPEARAAVVRRQRLVDVLHENIDKPLQIVSAPAGYGKTTLLADFAKDTELAVCWYSADETDRDPHRFLFHLFESIRARFPTLENPADPANAQPSGISADWHGLVNKLVDGIRRSVREFFVLVVDDFHLLADNTTVISAADLFIQRLPDNCRVILSTRELPQLASLPRLISQRRVSGLGSGELRFTADEIKELLKKDFDVDMSTEEAEKLEAESEGWITAILLTTHSLWKGLFKDVLVNKGQNALLFEYMASEVFSQQSPSIQRFLLNTSILNEFDADIANTLNGIFSAAAILKEIEGRNLFVTRLEGPHSWYRYHHLFREFLREKLKKEDAEAFARIHARAADYYVANGGPRQAIQHYIDAAEFERALDVLDEQADALSHEGLWDTLGNWLEQIPEGNRARRPRLLLQLASVYQRSSKMDEAVNLLTNVIETFRVQGDRVLEARALMTRSRSLRSKGALQMAIRDARRALALLQGQGRPGDEADARAHLGRSYAQQGKYPSAEREFKLALEAFQEQGDLYQLSDVHTLLGLVYTYLGDSIKALTHYDLARQGWKRLGNQSQLALSLNNIAYLYYQQGRYDDAEPWINEAVTISRTTGSKQREALCLLTLAEIQREQGQYAEALTSYQRGLELARECMEATLISEGLVGLGETYRLTGDILKAKGYIKEGTTLALEKGQEHVVGAGYTSLGVLACEARSYGESMALLQKACALLERARQKRNLARAKFHLAHALFQSRRYPEALDLLQEVTALCEEMGHDRFLVSDAMGAPLMVQYAAVNKGPGREFYARLGEQVNRASPVEGVIQPSGEAASQAAQVAIRAPRVEARSLGSAKITLDSNPILNTAWGSSKAREMFMFMLYHGQPLHKDKIVDSLWPQISSSKTNSNFHSTLHRMKTALYPNCVEREGELYKLNPQWEFWLDAREFERMLREAEALPAGDPRLEELVSSAITLYKGAFLEEFDSPWCDQLRTELEQKFWKAVTGRAERLQARGQLQQAIAALENALAIDELQEQTYYKIMDLYLELGDTTSATRIYKRCLSVFGETVSFASSPKVTNILSHLN
ncbi:MAG: tetratricopeptide repeat protein [Chloroflexi bacterium]|nr:tetratricopeptide repeat protein [Chloroflexota bacterium]